MSMSEALARAQLEAEAKRLGIQPWELEMARATPTNVVRDVVRDLRNGPAQRSSGMGEEPAKARQGAVAVERPLRPPPGLSLVDQLCDLQDRIDREERARQLAKAGPKPGGGAA